MAKAQDQADTNVTTVTPVGSRWRLLIKENALLFAVALVDFLVHMAVSNHYGYFRDELYYLEDGLHPALGYVDQAPLIGWLAVGTHVLFQNSLVGIHLLPALVAACTVFIAGLIARELGGGRFAQVMAALATSCGLVYLATGSIFSMDSIDELLWTLGALVLIRLLKRDDPKQWLWFGVIAGVGLLNKYTILFFGFGIVVGLLLTPQRRQFQTRWLWIGGLLAFALALPDVVWNATHDWATVDFWRHYGGLTGGGPLSFLENQLIIFNPLNLPLVILGLIYFFSPQGKPYRALGWAFVILYTLLTLINAKPYFLGPMYPVLLAAGAVRFKQSVQQARWKWARPTYLLAILASGLVFAPIAIPVLPPATFAHSYAASLAALGNGGAGQQNAGIFPQYLGDRFGWDELVTTVQQVDLALPLEEQRQACVFTQNYGEASALDLLGTSAHLPPVISGHNNFYFWGYGTCTGQVLIMVNIAEGQALQFYQQVTQVTTLTCQYCMGSEQGAPILVCTQPKVSMAEFWQDMKHFD